MSTGVGMPSIQGPSCNTPLIWSPTLAPIARVVKLNDLEDVLFCLNEKVVGRREEKFLFFVAAFPKVVGDAVVVVVKDLSTEDIGVVLVGAVTLQEENNNLAEGDDVSRAISLKRIYFPTAWCYLFIILRGACVFKARRKSKVFLRAWWTRFLRFSEKGKKTSRWADKGLVHQKEKKEFTTERKRTTLLKKK